MGFWYPKRVDVLARWVGTYDAESEMPPDSLTLGEDGRFELRTAAAAYEFAAVTRYRGRWLALSEGELELEAAECEEDLEDGWTESRDVSPVSRRWKARTEAPVGGAVKTLFLDGRLYRRI